MTAATEVPRIPTFVRRIDVPLDVALARLSAWWEVAARRDGVDVGRSRVLTRAGAFAGCAGRRVRVVLDRGLLRSALPMELELHGWTTTRGTVLELLPARRFRPDDRYFREGHDVLDRVVAVAEGRSWR